MKISKMVDQLKDYDGALTNTVLGDLLKKEEDYAFNKRYHTIMVLVEINSLISYFSKQPSSKLLRINKCPTRSNMQILIKKLFPVINNQSILNYAPTSNKLFKHLKNKLLRNLNFIRINGDEKKERFIQEWLDFILYRETFKKHPKWAEEYIKEAKHQIKEKFYSKYNVGIDYFLNFKKVIEYLDNIDKRKGQNPREPRNVDNEVITKYKQFVWNEDRFIKAEVEDLIIYPPIFIESGGQYSIFPSPGLSYISDSYHFQQWQLMNDLHSNLNGDGSELVVKDFFIKDSIKFNVYGYEIIDRNTKGKADWCKIGIKVKNQNETFDLFSLLDEPDKNEYEIDILVRINNILLIGEIKTTSSYDKVREYYYDGTDKKKAEKTRLHAFQSWFSENIDKIEKLLQIPSIEGINICIPIFITNQVGDIIRDNDGILKLTHLDIMFRKHLKWVINSFIKSNTV